MKCLPPSVSWAITLGDHLHGERVATRGQDDFACWLLVLVGSACWSATVAAWAAKWWLRVSLMLRMAPSIKHLMRRHGAIAVMLFCRFFGVPHASISNAQICNACQERPDNPACMTRPVSQGAASSILSGAGLAGYARLLQDHCPVPLIDRAQARWEVRHGQLASKARTGHDGFYAPWVGLPPALTQVPVKVNQGF